MGIGVAIVGLTIVGGAVAAVAKARGTRFRFPTSADRLKEADLQGRLRGLGQVRVAAPRRRR